MKSQYDTTAPKIYMNLWVNSDLLTKSEALDINISAALEKILSEQLAEHATHQWVVQNRNAIRAYNQFVGESGCFADDYRSF